MADFDGDGLLDVAIVNNGQPFQLFLNQVKNNHSWLALSLEGRESNRDAVGAYVRIKVAGVTLTRSVEAGSGYASQGEATLYFGLGDATSLDAMEVTWPNGDKQHFDANQLKALPFKARYHLVEGENTWHPKLKSTAPLPRALD